MGERDDGCEARHVAGVGRQGELLDAAEGVECGVACKCVCTSRSEEACEREEGACKSHVLGSSGTRAICMPLEGRLATFSALLLALLEHVCFVSAAWRFVRGLVSAELVRPAQRPIM